ncbi:MAG: class I adenylate cyclase [Gammaproteobacteria bacterium]
MTAQSLKHTGALEGLDINAIKRRFLALNRERLRRVYVSLGTRQQTFMDLLPLLFHINHPMLPGYLSSKAPAGISDYSPTNRTIDAAKRLARSFTYRRRALHSLDIQALYLMGSSGSIAYSKNSDFDIWVCHRTDLPDAQRDMLARKAEAIESWAASLGLEVHFFVLDDVGFRRGAHQHISKESSGSAQHRLLLEEFYRTGLLAAGRYPVWWLVPPDREQDYDQYVHDLKHKRFIKPNESLDFGGVGILPAEEFFGAALWQLYKAVDSPYKSVLKIMLMECYASEYPRPEVLSLRFKRAVYRGETNLDRLDPYVSLTDKVEEYLTDRGDDTRLELARRCLYFKVNEPMSRPDTRRNATWRREAMRDLVNQWGWDQASLLMLDTRQTWKMHRVMEERRTLVDALTTSYRTLSQFARENADTLAIDPEELNLLGRRLYAAFERKAGKIDIINPGISTDLTEERLSLQRVTGQTQDGWLMYRGDLRENEASGQAALKRAHSLLEMVAWCHFNGLLHPVTTVINLLPRDNGVSPWELRAVLDSLQQLFPAAEHEPAEMDDLANPARIRRGGLFINLGIDPMSKLTRQGMQLTSNRTDALSFGGLWENLALTFDQIVATSWQEILTFHYTGDDALADCLCDYLAWSPIAGGNVPEPPACYSFSSTRGAAIARRIEELFHDAIECFYRSRWRDTARYVLRVAHTYYVLQVENGVPRYQRLESMDALLNILAAPQGRFSPVVLDRHTLSESPLPTILRANRPGVVQLFYQVTGDKAGVYVLDERGSLFHQKAPFHDSLTLLSQYQTFLEAVQQRRGCLGQGADPSAQTEELEFYQILRDAAGKNRLDKQNINPFRRSNNYLGIQVIGDLAESNRAVFTMYCNSREFSSVEFGDGLFEEVSRYVLAERASGEAYPIYITDIDLSRALLGTEHGETVQTVHFLNYKRRIEDRLNRALRGD